MRPRLAASWCQGPQSRWARPKEKVAGARIGLEGGPGPEQGVAQFQADGKAPLSQRDRRGKHLLQG